MAPTRLARNPNLLEGQCFHAEYRADRAFGDRCRQDVESGNAGSSTTKEPTESLSEEDATRALDQETEVYPVPTAHSLWPQTQVGQEQPQRHRCTRKSAVIFLIGCGLVVVVTVALAVALTLGKGGGSSAGPSPTTATTTTTVCSRLVARMVINKNCQNKNCQLYDDDQPDQRMWGIANTTVCLNGTVTASAKLRDGRSKLIAGQIHKAEKDGGDGANGIGPAVFSFCGSGSYIEGVSECADWSVDAGRRTSKNPDMEGKLSPESGLDGEARARDMLDNPKMYYFSFATDKSAEKTLHGAIRGQLEKRP